MSELILEKMLLFLINGEFPVHIKCDTFSSGQMTDLEKKKLVNKNNSKELVFHWCYKRWSFLKRKNTGIIYHILHFYKYNKTNTLFIYDFLEFWK